NTRACGRRCFWRVVWACRASAASSRRFATAGRDRFGPAAGSGSRGTAGAADLPVAEAASAF
ncbi:MAG: hypothetical protein WAU79_24725, partial [Bradyrhizobium sp.]|uniref:hypothetical protein n=1 Tax=Bradyrhizobium sp. TaxID=376 RepID=UPI003BB1E955